MFTFKKNILPNILPDLRPDLESWANFGLEQTFKILKNLQKHISASAVDQGHSIRSCLVIRKHTKFGTKFSIYRYDRPGPHTVDYRF